MRIIQFREAICEAMSEEMRLDQTIYLMGEIKNSAKNSPSWDFYGDGGDYMPPSPPYL